MYTTKIAVKQNNERCNIDSKSQSHGATS